MKATVKPLTRRRAWKALESHHERTKNLHLRELFAADPGRGARMTAEATGLFLDYSKNRITDETLKLLFELRVVPQLSRFRGNSLGVGFPLVLMGVFILLLAGSSSTGLTILGAAMTLGGLIAFFHPR